MGKNNYVYFAPKTDEISYQKTWIWLKKEIIREKLNLFLEQHRTTP